MTALWILAFLLILFLGIIVTRALRFTPRESPLPEPIPVTVDEESAIGHLQEMIRLKTVSHLDERMVEENEFISFQDLLETLYPAVHAECTREKLGTYGLLYRWKGSGEGSPSVLMAHYDVVPANEAEWQEPPFSGIIKDGELWGRGTLDTKGTLHGIMEAAEGLLKEGFVPKNDLYFAFGGNEEVMGVDAAAIVDELERRGVKPAFVLDEGGAIVEGVFPGVKKSAAVVGIAEKGTVFMDITAEGKGGHASAPPVRQSLTTLARALDRLARKPMPFTLTKPARELFDVLGRHSSFALKLVFANLWCFAPALDLICKASGGELNALVRTTCAFTRAKAAEAYNVLPTTATAGVNLRLISGDTSKDVCERMKKIIADDRITLSIVQGVEASGVSETCDEAWNRLDSAIRQTYPEALVAPYLMVAASDSRHYSKISDHVFRFSGMPLSKEQRGMIHNANERVPVEQIKRTVAFFARVIRLS